MRNVEADDGARHPLKPELPLQLVDRIGSPLFGFVAFEQRLFQQVPRVLFGQIDELSLRPALRDDNRCLAERFLHQFTIVEVEGSVELFSAVLQL